MEPAIRAALAVAAAHGVRCVDPVVLKDSSNLVVHLRPAPVVARIAATTALVRPGVGAWFARELSMAEYLVGRGFPVVEPSRELPAGPHEHDGVTMSFLTYVEHDRDAVPTPGEFARSLAELHAELRDYPGELPDRDPLDDVERCAAQFTGDHVATILAERDRLAQLINGSGQPLHGDAHPANVLVTERGLVWNDFEDTWRGPIHWDLAVMAGTSRFDGKVALAAYPGNPDPELVERWREMRDLQGVCWQLAAAARQPHRRSEAEAALAQWLQDVVRHTV